LSITFPSQWRRYVPIGPDCKQIVFADIPPSLLELERFFQKPASWDLVDDGLGREILEFLSRNIAEQLPPISAPHGSAWVIGELQGTHWPIGSILHGLAAAAIVRLPVRVTEGWVQGPLLRCVLAGMGSPDGCEAGSFKKLLDIGCGIFPELGERAVGVMCERLSIWPILA
jgi:hypothetical protein